MDTHHVNPEDAVQPVKKANPFLFSSTFSAILGAIASAIWIIIFGMGILIDSSRYRKALACSFDWNAFIMSIMVYTPTNIFILCVAAALVGGCASKMVVSSATRLANQQREGATPVMDDSAIYMSENPFTSMLRGVVVFFAFLAGVFVANSNLFFDPTPQGYTQAAGVVSLLSFVVGYDPTVFSSFLKIANKIPSK